MEKRLRAEIKTALSAKLKDKTSENENRYQTLKNILETAQKNAKEKQTELCDGFIIDAAKKEIKQLNDTMQYCKFGSDKEKELTFCISVAEEFLPRMATEEDIRYFLETIEVTNMGMAMKSLKTHFGDALDGKMASQIVKNLLIF